MRRRKLVALGLGCIALAGIIALVPTGPAADRAVAPRDAQAGSDVVFAGVLAEVPNLAAVAGQQWRALVPHLDNATYVLTGGDPDVTVLVTLPEAASGAVTVQGRVVTRLADDGTGKPLVLVRGHL